MHFLMNSMEIDGVILFDEKHEIVTHVNNVIKYDV